MAHFRVKPNRVSEGSLLSLWSFAGGLELWIMLGFVALLVGALVLLGLTVRREALPDGRFLYGRLVLSALMLPVLLALLGIGGGAALEAAGYDSGRAGPALGWWIAVLGAYLLYYDARRRTRTAGA
ncbi:MAG: hypothetical protein ACOC1I_03825, partial [Spirochaetota bacterium]